jgi:WD40 repeat protein
LQSGILKKRFQKCILNALTFNSTFEAHGGVIFQVEFSGEEGNLITCSEDGLVIIWDWRSGTCISSFMRHPSAVRAFDFNYDVSNQLFCARNDGYISVWNTEYMMRMENIEPEPKWQLNAQDECLLGYNNSQMGHSGMILLTEL